MGIRNASSIVLKGGHKPAAGPRIIEAVAPSPSVNKNSFNAFLGTISEDSYAHPFDVAVPKAEFLGLKDFSADDVELLKVNHENDYPLWMSPRDDDTIEKFTVMGLIKPAKDVTKIKLTKKGNQLAAAFKGDEVLPLGLLEQQTRAIGEKEIFSSAGMVSATVKGTPVISNSSFNDKWSFGLMEYDAESFDPEEKEIRILTDLDHSFEKKNKQFKEKVEAVMACGRDADTVLLPAGYREEMHRVLLRGEAAGKPLLLELPNNYYNYFHGKYPSAKFIFSASDAANTPEGNLGKDVVVSVVEDDKIVGSIASAFYFSSPAETDKLEKRLREIYS
jgi:hypothetical protein